MEILGKSFLSKNNFCAGFLRINYLDAYMKDEIG